MSMGTTRKTALWLTAIAVGMFGFGFALVPLYDVFCEAIGISRENINSLSEYVPEAAVVDTGRSVRVQFIATNDGTMPWEFHPHEFEIRVNPGAANTTTFFARNPAPRPMVAQAIPSIDPAEAAQYFHKTECFCFTQQSLAPGESLDMPLQFIVDQALPASIKTITLSYTLFDVTGKQPDSQVTAVN
ncbi:MAG: cytochrome c oxidase assembly protein [Gammaproteobacteria bacterium]|jgi:cytochrome c oxidase assembly protein subunit 11|nr:cytochrome c oxidase assembly protein [Gammaproteobacteria bacterium]MBK7168128.1 cytochrome c oxidase assembly protein [Gammaproteobacteria bacterium]